MALNINELYPSRWLSAADLSRPVVVTITATTIEEVRDMRTQTMNKKLCLAFAKATKRMLINKTQAMACASFLGPDAELWVGHQIQLLPDRSPNGKATIAVRRPPEQQSPAAAAENAPLSSAGATQDAPTTTLTGNPPTDPPSWGALVTAQEERKAATR